MTGNKSLSIRLFNDPDVVGSERYFITLTCFGATVILLLLCVLHISSGLKTAPVFFAATSMVITGVMYLLVRRGSCLYYPKLILSVLGLVLLDLTWYSKYLSNGPVLFFILIFAALIIWVWHGKGLLFMILFYFVNLLLLFIIDKNTPVLLIDYPSHEVRTIDIYLSFTIYSVLLIFLLIVVKSEFNRKEKKAIESDKLKSAFLANMSHEIRTPLNSIVGFSELLAGEDDSKTKGEYVQIIERSSSTLLKLLGDIIDLSKIEAGSTTINYTLFRVSDLLKSVQDHFHPIVRARQGDVVLIFDNQDDEALLFSDNLRIEQILINLISNSIKFTKRGKIVCGFKQIEKEVEFCVSDTGTGIREEDKSKIFDRFTRFNYDDLNIQGSGIGLSIAQSLITILGGRIWFNSTFGVGTKFYFTIPLPKETAVFPFTWGITGKEEAGARSEA